MACPKCGNLNVRPDTFCSQCGTRITRTPQTSETQVWTPGQGWAAGQVIEQKYRIDGEIGAGGMGSVFRATRLMIGDAVALKILHPEQLRDPSMAERFRREAQAAAKLKHPNAVTIYDFGVAGDGTVYLVMELAEGRTLRSLIKGGGPIEPAAAAVIITQVCSALEEAHRHNIVHRDIKPDNIMVQETEEGIRAKVLDFGIARMRTIGATAQLTQAGSVLGTPHYMSPEQCMGQELDHRSDIYSLGVVLFEMLAGVVPFNSPTSSAVIIQHVSQAPPPLRVLNVSISPELEAVVLRALAKAPEERPQSAKAFAEEVNQALESRVAPKRTAAPAMPVPAAETTAMPHLSSTPPAPGVPAAAGPGMAATVAAKAPAWSSAPEAASPAARATTPAPAVSKTRDTRVWVMGGAAVLVLALVAGGVWLGLGGGSKSDVEVTGEQTTQKAPEAAPKAPAEDPSSASVTKPSSVTVASPGTSETGSGSPENRPKLESGPVASPAPRGQVTPPAPASANRAALTLRSNPANTQVLVNGKPSGSTDASGFLSLPELTPGTYLITVQHEYYEPQERRVTLAAGRSEILEVTLAPRPSQVSIEVNVPGAKIEIPRVGNYTNQVEGLQLRPGQYQVNVSKDGYRTQTTSFEVRPGQMEKVQVTLEAAPIEDQLGGLEQALQRRQFDAVIRGASGLLASNPNHPRLNYLMGLSYMGKGVPQEALNYYTRAIQNGEVIRVPIKHHHRAGLNDDLCNGVLTFSRGSLAFNSTDRPGHDFTTPMSGVAGMKWEPQKAARINMDVLLGGDRRDYNFQHTTTQLVRAQPGNPNSLIVLLCPGCEPEMNFLYQLLLRLKQ